MGNDTNFDQLAVNALRFLSVDQVEAANSGHPGLPLGAAPMTYTLFRRHLRFDPLNPEWVNRDRFVLSAGHGSALLYSLLYVFGYEIQLDDLKEFRQIHSITPGHPEFGVTPGVEATTGPLGQGLGMAAGMALAERWMNDRYKGLIDHHVYALVSDGDLMEGIGAEAASLAGHLGLGKLICLYDDNSISLDGDTSMSFSENVPMRFQAYNWQVITVEDGNDLDAIDAAITEAKANTSQPTLISVKTVIGFGSPKAGTSSAHGSPLGKEATLATKQALGWPTEHAFHVPAEVGAISMESRDEGARMSSQWMEKRDAFEEASPELAAELEIIAERELPEGWDEKVLNLVFPSGKEIATRDAGKTVLNALAEGIPWMVGGSADLVSSTKTQITGGGDFSKTNPSGRNVWFGVREHAMGAMVNGMALSGLQPFGSTFLVFSDYMRGAIRLSALMEIPSVWVFTHDSVFVGEDGPTHQPIEHVASLRLIPGLKVYRPADAYETAACWHDAISRQEPACIVLTRQNLPVFEEHKEKIWEGVPQGAYILYSTEGKEPQVVLMASGSEVSLALETAGVLEDRDYGVAVVSVPCLDILEEMEYVTFDEELNPTAPRITIEAGVTRGWESQSMPFGLEFGINSFGHSAPGQAVYRTFGLDPITLSDEIQAHLEELGTEEELWDAEEEEAKD